MKISQLTSLTNKHLAFLCARLAFGISFMTHGMVRLPKLNGFAHGISERFADTFLAGFPSLSVGYVIPIVETLAGLAIVLGGRFVRWGLVAGILLMGALMFGTCVLEKWSLLVSQLVHLAVFYMLLINPHCPGPVSGQKAQ